MSSRIIIYEIIVVMHIYSSNDAGLVNNSDVAQCLLVMHYLYLGVGVYYNNLPSCRPNALYNVYGLYLTFFLTSI
jgi:hypothetical protein